MSDDDFKARMNYHLSVPIKSSVQDKVREEELLEKYMQNLGKFEVAHIVAMVLTNLFFFQRNGNFFQSSNNFFQTMPKKQIFSEEWQLFQKQVFDCFRRIQWIPLCVFTSDAPKLPTYPAPKWIF
jgi:hypothetical protein